MSLPQNGTPIPLWLKLAYNQVVQQANSIKIRKIVKLQACLEKIILEGHKFSAETKTQTNLVSLDISAEQ